VTHSNRRAVHSLPQQAESPGFKAAPVHALSATTVNAAFPVYECDLPPAVANDGPLNSTSMDTSIESPTPMVVPGAGTP
jgi:hypothetical protein